MYRLFRCLCISFCIIFSLVNIVFGDTVNDALVQSIDQTYMTIVDKAPKNTRLRRSQQRYRNKIEKNLTQSLQDSEWNTLIAYQVLGVKIYQRSKTFKFTTSDLITQFTLFNETNRIRKQYGKTLLTYNILLSLSAYDHANDMYRNFPNRNGEMLSHISFNGDTIKERVEKFWYMWSTLAENIAWNQDTVDQVINDWMDSDWHKKNILSDTVSEVGLAKVWPYRVQDFWTQRINK